MQQAAAEDGKGRIVYKEWPIFGARSERAALASRYQGIYAAVHHALMTGKRPDAAMLRETVTRAGGNWPQLERDLQAHRGEIVRGGLKEAQFLKTIAAARRADQSAMGR